MCDKELYELMNYYSNILTYIIKQEYMRIYYQKNKQKRKQEYQENKEERKQEYQKNKEERLEYQKEYNQTPNGKQANKISDWKHMGLICDDYNALYEKYLNTHNCENCDCVLTIDRWNTSTTRVMDHDHTTGLFRNILCHACNIRRK